MTKSSSEQEIVRDRISDLPDCILHHILSFLPTREVVATSLLSRRWSSLWLSMTTFDFDNTSYPIAEDFLQFADAVIFMADSRPVEKFRLRSVWLTNSCYDRYMRMEMKINIWINTLIHRKVQHLELCFGIGYLQLTPRIFKCGCIRVLKLERVTLNTFYSVDLPLLKVMHLVKVELPDFESLANLLSRCPLLQELELDYLDFVNDDDDDDDDDNDNDDDGNDDDEDNDDHGDGDGDVTLDVEKLQHLVSATVPCYLIQGKAFTNVTLLRLNTETSSGHDFPRFENLTHLEFSCLWEEDLNWMVEGLRNCPKLEILVIDELAVHYVDTDDDTEGVSMKPTLLNVPQCLLSHLKEFTLGEYRGWELEFELARCIMKNARVLRTISIFCGYTVSYEKYDYLNRLASCPRGSEHCRLLFK